MFKKYSTLELTFIMLMAACGVALKPIIGPMAKILGSALLLPSGALAGAIYMLWPMLALLVVGRTGAAVLVGLLEGLIVMVTGLYGSHGFLSIITYVLPCIVMDYTFILIGRYTYPKLFFFPTAFANLTGAIMVGWWIKRLPMTPFLISLIPSFLIGGTGGLLAALLYKKLISRFPQFNHREVC
ncbi:ECF transporter S component [bacterium]|nr:ECF transporter S component [bacterium]